MSIRALLPLALLLALGVGLAASPVLVDSANADVLVPGQRRRPRPRPRPRPDPKPPLVAPSRPIVIATLTSPAFAPGKDIPTVHTCEGADTSPALRWDKLPRGTVSVAIIVRDPDAPDPRKPVRTWHHWVLWDLPPEAGGLPDDSATKGLPLGTRVGKNDWGKAAWGGPCPPIGKHRYFFELYALDRKLGVRADGVGTVDAPDDAAHSAEIDAVKLQAAMVGHVLGRATLIGRYQKQTPPPPPAPKKSTKRKK